MKRDWISSKDLPLVSGTSLAMNTNPRPVTVANIRNVPEIIQRYKLY